MPTPLKWNAPGAKWSSALKWNGVQATPKTMKVKAIIDFTPYSAPELGPVAQTIHDQMLAHATDFPLPPVSMTALATLIAAYTDKLSKRASNASADVLAFNLARHDLEVALGELGAYVNTVAKGDATLVGNSGFPSYTTARPTSTGAPAAPTNVRLRPGDLSGSIVARCHPDRQNSMNVAQTNTGDPNDESAWKPAATFRGGKVTLSGLPVGSTVWVRIATVGTGAVVGAWSDPARIVVT